MFNCSREGGTGPLPSLPITSVSPDVLPQVFNPRHACAGRLRYLSCVLCVCVYMSVSVCLTTLASTSFVSTFQVRYVRLSFRLFLIFNSWISIKPSVQKLWCEKAYMLMSICLLRPPLALIQQPFAPIFDY